jgi:hypothetical protein
LDLCIGKGGKKALAEATRSFDRSHQKRKVSNFPLFASGCGAISVVSDLWSESRIFWNFSTATVVFPFSHPNLSNSSSVERSMRINSE